MARLKTVRKLPAVIHKSRVVRLSVSNSLASRRTAKVIPVRSAPVRPIVRQKTQIPTKKVGVHLTKAVSDKRVEDNSPRTPKRHYTPRIPEPDNRIVRPAYARKKQQYVNQSPSRTQKIKAKNDARYSQYNSKIQALKDVGKGKVLIILACGPSIKEAPLELITGHPLIEFMAINQPYGYYPERCPKKHRDIWPTRYWAFCDHSQYKRNQETWDRYKGLILNSAAVKARHPKQIIIKHRGGKGFSKDMMSGYHIGRSSTFANMQVAFYMNYDKVYIFGLDMGEVDGKLHHYGQNPDVANDNRKARFASEAEHYGHAVRTLTPKEREMFVICSSYNKWPFADNFPRLHQKDAPAIILKYVGGSKDIEKENNDEESEVPQET